MVMRYLDKDFAIAAQVVPDAGAAASGQANPS